MAERIAEAFVVMSELAEALGVRDINALPGLWEQKVDECWTVRVNGHREEREHVPPYHMAIEYNGVPAGIVGPGGGIIVAGEAANEETFIAALRARIAREKA